ncbi:MAG: hypothetical protein ACFB00_08580 [Parvularculaceae bacterium]
MREFVFIVIGAAAVGCASQDVAAPSQAAVAPSQAVVAPSQAVVANGSSAPDGDDVVCVNIRATGSRLNTERVCKTKDQWEQERERQSRDIRTFQYDSQLPF